MLLLSVYSTKKFDGQCEIFGEKNWRQNAFLAAKKKSGFESARKNLRPFSQILVLVRLQGLFLKGSHQATVFFSLTAVSVELAMLPGCDPRLSKNALCQQAARPSKEFWWCLLGRAPFTKTTL